VDLHDRFRQLAIGDGAQRRGTGPPRVERRAGHTDQVAHALDRELCLVLGNEAQTDHRIVSRAKKAAAPFQDLLVGAQLDDLSAQTFPSLSSFLLPA